MKMSLEEYLCNFKPGNYFERLGRIYEVTGRPEYNKYFNLWTVSVSWRDREISGEIIDFQGTKVIYQYKKDPINNKYLEQDIIKFI